MRRAWCLVAVVAATAAILSPATASAEHPTASLLRAGVAKVDSTWHVGASAGQYASDGFAVGSHGVDPSAHSTRRAPATGIQSREWVRALVVEGARGQRWALVANDLYIPQDLVNRRVGAILREHDRLAALGLGDGPVTGIDESTMTVSVSHSHSSPYYSTPSWGVWAFQDVFDVRFFEHIAQAMARAVIEASGDLRPARMGANTVRFTDLKRHSFGPQVADDGTPAGYPQTDVDAILNVIRFDDLTDPHRPAALATWVVFGLHPEMLDGNNLLTGEYVNTMYRFVDREVGGVTLFSQNDTGTAEPARDGVAHAPQERQEFSHREYAQMERAARTLADAVEGARAGIEDCTEVRDEVCVPFATDLEVGVSDLRFAPPSYRPLPTVSSCRTERAVRGDPGIPIAGLPDCEYALGGTTRPIVERSPVDPGVTYDMLREAGVPVPDNVGGPSYTGLQETVQVHLQAIRLGGVVVTVCPCEQWADQSRNIRSRLNRKDGDLWLGFDWTAQRTPAGRAWCVANGDATWTCADPRNPSRDLAPVTDLAYRRMVAQVNNDAAGWEDLAYTPYAEYDPPDPADIKGNFTHAELTANGYPLVVTVGMSNDYWGYIASYREFQRGDHYRKALTGLGPHSMDFLATRLTRMAASLNGGPAVQRTPKDVAYDADGPHQSSRADAIGKLAQAGVPVYERTLPPDGGAPEILAQPSSIERFAATAISWVGGSNWIDTPDARVERLVDGRWTPFADGSGEVQVKANFPSPGELAAYEAGRFVWVWEATFEAFASDIDLTDASGRAYRATPAGTYRFVVDGTHRPTREGAPVRYRLTSEPFEVQPWSGLTVTDIRRENDDRVSFTVGPVGVYTFPSGAVETVGPIDYPDTYDSIFRFIRRRVANEKDNRKVYAGGHVELFCVECSFRPWADVGRVASAVVTVDGSGSTVTAVLDTDGRFRTLAAVPSPAFVDTGGVTDAFGHANVAATVRV